jgi:hypothetical protein
VLGPGGETCSRSCHPGKSSNAVFGAGEGSDDFND